MTPRPAPLAERTDTADVLHLFETIAVAATDLKATANTLLWSRRLIHRSIAPDERFVVCPADLITTARSAAERVLAAITEYEAGR